MALHQKRQISSRNANNWDKKAKQVRAEYQKAVIRFTVPNLGGRFFRQGYLPTNSPRTGWKPLVHSSALTHTPSVNTAAGQADSPSLGMDIQLQASLKRRHQGDEAHCIDQLLLTEPGGLRHPQLEIRASYEPHGPSYSSHGLDTQTFFPLRSAFLLFFFPRRSADGQHW